jgi:hypothetical protein
MWESQQELSCNIFRKNGDGDTAIEMQTVNGDWEVQRSNGINQSCIGENIRRSTPASNMPSLQRDQIVLLGWTGNTDISKDILAGKLGQRLHPTKKKLGMHLETPTKVRQSSLIRTKSSKEEYTQAWKMPRVHIIRKIRFAL